MSVDDKVDLILQRLEEQNKHPKVKDAWDKAQIGLSAFTGLVAIGLTIANLIFTSNINKRALKQQEAISNQQKQFQDNEDKRNRRGEAIEEIKVIPSLVAMRDKGDVTMRNLAKGIFEFIRKDTTWLNLPFEVFSGLPNDSTPDKEDIGRAFWVFLGGWHNSVWQPRNFDIEKIPNKGDLIVSLNAVFERDTTPTSYGNPQDNKWVLGYSIGLLKPNERVQVIDTQMLYGNYCWAKVQFR